MFFSNVASSHYKINHPHLFLCFYFCPSLLATVHPCPSSSLSIFLFQHLPSYLSFFSLSVLFVCPPFLSYLSVLHVCPPCLSSLSVLIYPHPSLICPHPSFFSILVHPCVFSFIFVHPPNLVYLVCLVIPHPCFLSVLVHPCTFSSIFVHPPHLAYSAHLVIPVLVETQVDRMYLLICSALDNSISHVVAQQQQQTLWMQNQVGVSSSVLLLHYSTICEKLSQISSFQQRAPLGTLFKVERNNK